MEAQSGNSIPKIMEENKDKPFAIYKDNAGTCYLKFEGQEEIIIHNIEYDFLQKYKNDIFNKKMNE